MRLIYISTLLFSISLFLGPVSADVSSTGVDVEEKWSEGNLPYKEISMSDGKIFVALQFNGGITSYNQEGEMEWENEDIGRHMSVDDSTGFSSYTKCVKEVLNSCSEEEKIISAWNLNDGSEKWSIEVDGIESVWATGVDEDIIVVGGRDGKVKAFDRDTRQEVWSHEYHEDYITSVEFGDEKVYTSDFEGRIVAADKDQGELLWSNSELSDNTLDAIRDLEHRNDRLYVAGSDIVVVDSHGETEWTYKPEFAEKLDRFVAWQLEFTEDGAVIMGGDGNFIGVDLQERSQLWNFVDEDRTSPSGFEIDQNNIYAAGVGGDIVRYRFEEVEKDKQNFENVDIQVEEESGRLYRFSTDVESDNGIDQIEWDFGSGEGTKTGRTVVHDFSDTGQYQVNMSVRDVVGQTVSVERSVNPEIDRGRPEASIILPKDEYNAQDPGEAKIEISESGSYKVKITGAGVDYVETFEEGDIPESVTFEPESEGEVVAEIYAPSDFWGSIIGVIPGIEGDKLVDSDTEVVRAVPGSKPEVELSGEDYIIPEDGPDGDLPEETYTAEINTDPEDAEIVEYEWSVVGLLEEEYEVDGNQLSVNWDEETPGRYIIELIVVDEYDRESKVEEFEVVVEESSISVPDSPDKLGETATIEAEVTEKIAETGYEIDIFGLEEVDADTSDDGEVVYGEQEYTMEYEPRDTGRYRVFLRDSPDGTGHTIDEAFFYLGDDAPVGDADLEIIDISYPRETSWDSIPIEFTVRNTGEHGEDPAELYIDGKKMTQDVITLEEGETTTKTLKTFTDRNKKIIDFELRTEDDSETGEIIITSEENSDDTGEDEGSNDDEENSENDDSGEQPLKDFNFETSLPELSDVKKAFEYRNLLLKYGDKSGDLGKKAVRDAERDYISDQISEEDLAVVKHFYREGLEVKELLRKGDSTLTVSQQDQLDSDTSTSVLANVRPSIAQNGYLIEVRDDSESVIASKSSSKISDSLEINIDESGIYNAQIRLQEGLIERGIRLITGNGNVLVTETEFLIGEASDEETIEELDAWRAYCQENNYDTMSASGRISCIKQAIDPECLDKNPDAQCRKIANSICEYYLGTDFNPEEGRCRE